MVPDVMGFLYPQVDESKCVECGLCEKVCAFHPDYDHSLNLPVPEAYGTRHKDMGQVMRSQSGAAFVAISDYVLEQGGVVYGAGYKDHFRVAHKRATTKEERDEFRGSKYVQSDLTGVFKRVKQDLKEGLTVLFSGTPCQTAGLNSYVGKRLRENLILVDLVCHGVPGPYLWRDYLAYLEKKQGDILCYVNFRDKSFGWRAHVESFKYVKEGKMNYTYLFYQHIAFRKSCGKCPYCNTQRPSDLTISDFWGGEKVVPEFCEDNKGCSLILVNTSKGREILEAIKPQLRIRQVALEDCLQPNLCHPSAFHPKRDQFERDYTRLGFERALKKNGLMGWRLTMRNIGRKIRHSIVCLIPRAVKVWIKTTLLHR